LLSGIRSHTRQLAIWLRPSGGPVNGLSVPITTAKAYVKAGVTSMYVDATMIAALDALSAAAKYVP
jgi:hypothetical protein